MKTVYKVLTPGLKSVADYFPNFPKDLVIQYTPETWITGVENSPVFCFTSLADATEWAEAMKKVRWYREGVQAGRSYSFDIWECKGVAVRKRSYRVGVKGSNFMIFMSLFRKLWAGGKSVHFSRPSRDNQYTAQKLCLVKRIAIVT
jgi:hypothetical protein